MLSYARSGGTLLNRCLGALPNTVVMSEVGPWGGGGGVSWNDRREVHEQALDWFDIYLKSSDYLSGLLELEGICDRSNRYLIVREWCYANFNRHGSLPPYTPPQNLWTLEQLHEKGIETKAFALVRDARDMWASMNYPEPNRFFASYRRFAEALSSAKDVPIFKYENFTADPETGLKSICDYLEIPFTQDWKDFPYFLDVSGDSADNKGFYPPPNKGRDLNPVRKARRCTLSPYRRFQIVKNPDFFEANHLLGYSDTDDMMPAALAVTFDFFILIPFSKVKAKLRRLNGKVKRRLKYLESELPRLRNALEKRYDQWIGRKFEPITSPSRWGFEVLTLNRDELLPTAQYENTSSFPNSIDVAVDALPNDPVDVDVIIGAFRDADLASEVVRNFSLLETKARLHFYIVETSGDRASLNRLPKGKNITRVYLNQRLSALERDTEPKLFASNGAALSAQLGFFLGRSRYAFYTHTDMMGCQKDFISYLLERLDENTPLASYSLRHIFPFSAGAIYDKAFFSESAIDWLPMTTTPDMPTDIQTLYEQGLDELSWIDAGEQYVYEVLRRQARMVVIDSYGDSVAYLRSARLQKTNLLQCAYKLPLVYEEAPVARKDIIKNYPELAQQGRVWRKSFDINGRLVFIHRSRGVSVRHGRGGFYQYLKAFNDSWSKGS